MSKPPGRLRAQHEAVRWGGRLDPAAPIGVSERCAEILGGQRQRGAALKHEMMVSAEERRTIAVAAEKHGSCPAKWPRDRHALAACGFLRPAPENADPARVYR